MAARIPADTLLADILTYKPTERVQEVSHWTQEGRRLLIFATRLRGSVPNHLTAKSLDGDVDLDGEVINDANEQYSSSQNVLIAKSPQDDVDLDGQIIEPVQNTNTLNSLDALSPEGNELTAADISEIRSNSVKLINLDKKDTSGTLGYETIILPFIPKELNITPDSKFNKISTMGRNLPFYHFTGSEDIVEFEIDWHSFDENREDVIKGCRYIESLSKNNGYYNTVPRVKLIWGNDNLLFRDSFFVVLSAPYRLSNFTNGFKKDGIFINNKLLPTQAYQTIKLGKVSTSNPTTSKITKL